MTLEQSSSRNEVLNSLQRLGISQERPLKIAWFSYFPVEWLPEPPPPLRQIPKQHPATWQRVLWEELRHDPQLDLHIFSLRKDYSHSFTFQRDNTTFHCLKTPGGAESKPGANNMAGE